MKLANQTLHSASRLFLKPLRRVVKKFKTGHLFRAKRATRTWLALRRRNRCAGKFIAVTGSSAKSTSTALLSHILEGHGKVKGQVLSNTFRSIHKTVRAVSKDSDYVVVEAGVAGKDQMVHMARVIQPDVAIVTLVGMEHYSAFRSREAVASEKGGLVEAVRKGGFALLNADDDLVMSMALRTRERIVTFGRERQADYRVTEAFAAFPENLSLTLKWSGGSMRLKTQFPAEHFWLPTVAAAAAALELGVPEAIIVERVASFGGLRSRCQVIRIPDGPTFIVDSAKAPYDTLNLAFQMLAKSTVEHKRAVLGHVSDHKVKPRRAYRQFYQSLRELASQVIFVGDHAHRSGASDEDRQTDRFKEFGQVRAAYEYIRASAQKDELILLKSSSNLHLERIALAWDHNIKCWVDECGKTKDCVHCGLYSHPFNEHRKVRRLQARQRLFAPLRAWGKYSSQSE